MILLLLAVSLLPAGPFGASAAGAADDDIVPRLTVRGAAELQVPADRVRFVVGVENEASTTAAALEENSRRLQRVEAALRQAGMEVGEDETALLQVYPVWTQRPQSAPEDWRPRVAGYRAESRLRITTIRLELAGRLIAAAVEGGATGVDDIRFDLAAPRRYRAQAIAVATANARADAEALAAAAGVRLVEVIDLQLDHAQARPLLRQAAELMAAPARADNAGAGAPSLIPGEVTVRAAVIMSCRIAAGHE
ncbi:MAG: SIMPL domain-containing protein [Deltaproteobacteria bacterium]|nr:SIMPL domain-containing protein [Candidatus Anaeroferrophillacea bacterium]